MAHGPIEVLFFTFPSSVTLGEIGAVIRKPVDSKAVRLVDMVVMTRTGDDTIEVRDIEEDSGLPPEFDDLPFDPNSLLNDADIEVLVEGIEEGEQGVALVIEHVWARETAADIDALGGQIVMYARVPVEDVEAAFAADVSA
jgi:hypothetical protein